MSLNITGIIKNPGIRLKTVFFRWRAGWYGAQLKLRSQEGGFFFLRQLFNGSVDTAGINLLDDLCWFTKQPAVSWPGAGGGAWAEQSGAGAGAGAEQRRGLRGVLSWGSCCCHLTPKYGGAAGFWGRVLLLHTEARRGHISTWGEYPAWNQ